MATEVEVLELLLSMVQALKPAVVIETGTYIGLGTLYLAKAASTYRGGVWTAEPDADRLARARTLIDSHQLTSAVAFHQYTGEFMIQNFQRLIDFAFLDSNLDTRIGEMRALLPKLAPNGVVAVHDTNTYHAKNGGPRNPLLDFARDNGFQAFNFDTPRGLMLLRRGVK